MVNFRTRDNNWEFNILYSYNKQLLSESQQFDSVCRSIIHIQYIIGIINDINTNSSSLLIANNENVEPSKYFID